MNYEETIELEKNVKIKNEADALYKKFNKFVALSAGKFDHENDRFTINKDQNNATYLSIKGGSFIYQCRFLHETYNCIVTPSSIFGYVKNNYRGLAHFKSWIESLERKSINQGDKN
jgi:hypothetical protein